MVSPVSLRLYRASLHAYPTSFRREYGPALVQSLMDQHRAEGIALWRVAVREIADVASTAPRMRGESPMTRYVVAVGTLTACIAAAVAVGPIAVLAVLAASAAIWFGFARSTPTAEHVARQGEPSWWLVAGFVALAGAIIVPAVDGGELSEAWWSVMAALILAGIALLVTAAIKFASRHAYRPTP
jgi:hypothetical protein